MRKKLVLWGKNATEEKLLIGIELLDKENKVNIHCFPEEVATEDFYKQMMNDWREGKEMTFPENHKVIERDLNITESILPEDILVDRTDLINRAKTEWHFVVLSSKMNEMYGDELQELKEKVSQLTKFDSGIWNDMKTFWGKVDAQVREKNLFRDHAQSLREKTNEIFGTLKELKSDLEKEFKEKSKVVQSEFNEMLDNVQQKIDKDLGLKPIFEELKSIQNKFNDAEFTREDRKAIWKRLDGYFKVVKEKRFGGSQQNQGGANNAYDRVKRRYDGLLSAIDKMSVSIKRDEDEMSFQERKINTTDGQLEQEIRMAKLQMIKQRVESKQVKLNDMLETKKSLEDRLTKEKERQAAIDRKKEVAKAKGDVKDKIAQEIKAKEAARKPTDEKLKEAASQLASKKNTKKAATPPAEVSKAEKKIAAKEEVAASAPIEPSEEQVEKVKKAAKAKSKVSLEEE